MNPTETEIAPLLVETLRVKAEQVSDVVEPFDPTITIMDVEDHPRRSRHLVAATVLVIAFIAVTGLAFALNNRDEATTRSRGAETPVAHLSIESTPALTFQSKTYTTSPGLNEITFTSAGGTHILKFDDPALADFRLTASDSPAHGEVRLEAGRDYTIYCGIPGHRDAGEVAVIHVMGTPVAHLSIESTPELTFQSKTYTTSPGLNEIDFTSAGGTHSLKFDDPALADFRLNATDESQSHGEVRLEAGKDYTIYCALAGHREAGEEAVIHVTAQGSSGVGGQVTG